MTLIPVAKIKVKPITPLWIGGYEAATYSPEPGLVEPIRPYEIKGALRWMVRNLAFSAVYDDLKDIEDDIARAERAERIAINFTEKILGQAGGDYGGASLYVIRIEKPEGGIIYPVEGSDGHLDQDKLPRDWPKYEQTILEYYFDCKMDKCDRNVGIIIASYKIENEQGEKSKILLPLPYIDREASDIHSDPENDRQYLIKVFRNMLDNLGEVTRSYQRFYEDLLNKDLTNILRLRVYNLGGVKRRYQLDIEEKKVTKLISIGNPRTKLQSLGKEPAKKATKVFMIPPINDIAIGIYRRRDTILPKSYRTIDGDLIKILDRVMIRSLQLALILKGVGKATNRGYGSFEITDDEITDTKPGEALETHDLELLKQITSTSYIIDMVERTKEDLKELVKKVSGKDYKDYNIGTTGDRRIRVYPGFIKNRYNVSLVLSNINEEAILYVLDLINYAVTSRILMKRRDIDEKCALVLGLPRGKICVQPRSSKRGSQRRKKELKRLPSLIRIRVVKHSETEYGILIYSFYPITNIIDINNIDCKITEELNICIKCIESKIKRIISNGVGVEYAGT